MAVFVLGENQNVIQIDENALNVFEDLLETYCKGIVVPSEEDVERAKVLARQLPDSSFPAYPGSVFETPL